MKAKPEVKFTQEDEFLDFRMSFAQEGQFRDPYDPYNHIL